MPEQRTFIAIDLKSFYASVECVDRGLDLAAKENMPQQLDLFTDYEALEKQKQEEKAKLDKERRMQEAQLKIKQRFGKNAILRGLNFEEGATAKERNKQIGGHKA